MSQMLNGIPVQQPLPHPPAEPFWEAVEAGALRLRRCSTCGVWQWYPLPVCGSCQGAEFSWDEVPPRGTVFTFSKVHRSFLPEGAVAVPYYVALVTLDGVDGPRLVSVLHGCDDREPYPGMSVRSEVLDLGTHRLPVFAPDGDAR